MTPNGQRADADGPGVLTLIREDLRHHWGEPTRPGFQAIAIYRIRHLLHRDAAGPFAALAGLLLRPLDGLVRYRFGISLDPTAELGRRLSIGHQGGIHIGRNVTMGDDCAILQGVRIGPERGDTGVGGSPTVGHRVRIGARSHVRGDVRVGDEARIGPNAIITVDVPAGATAVARPSKVVRAQAPPGIEPAEVGPAGG